MTRGLILGKFAPLHRGHQLLIERSLAQCDETVVLVYESREVTRIPLSVRAGWIRSLYPAALVIEGVDSPSASGRDPAVMRLQEEYVGRMVPRPITHFFCSEWYGAHVSSYLGAVDARFDEARIAAPVSGTMIRANPAAHRDWLEAGVLEDILRWDGHP